MNIFIRHVYKIRISKYQNIFCNGQYFNHEYPKSLSQGTKHKTSYFSAINNQPFFVLTIIII